jgi:hypothetical protein
MFFCIYLPSICFCFSYYSQNYFKYLIYNIYFFIFRQSLLSMRRTVLSEFVSSLSKSKQKQIRVKKINKLTNNNICFLRSSLDIVLSVASPVHRESLLSMWSAHSPPPDRMSVGKGSHILHNYIQKVKEKNEKKQNKKGRKKLRFRFRFDVSLPHFIL